MSYLLRLSPAEILFLLHCYAVPGPYTDVGDAGYEQFVKKFTDLGVIEPYKDQEQMWGRVAYSTTEKGNTWVEMICRTPEPVAAWVDPRTKEVIER